MAGASPSGEGGRVIIELVTHDGIQLSDGFEAALKALVNSGGGRDALFDIHILNVDRLLKAFDVGGKFQTVGGKFSQVGCFRRLDGLIIAGRRKTFSQTASAGAVQCARPSV
jgi:hypothetical protein